MIISKNFIAIVQVHIVLPADTLSLEKVNLFISDVDILTIKSVQLPKTQSFVCTVWEIEVTSLPTISIP